jgi:hypothetical protein
VSLKVSARSWWGRHATLPSTEVNRAEPPPTRRRSASLTRKLRRPNKPFVVLALLALTSACTLLKPSGPTEVARGEYYAAGKPEYDAFFIQLHQLQVELLAAPEEPQTVRRELAESAGLTADASDESLSTRLGQELKKLADRGLRVRLEVPEPSNVVDASATLHTSESGLSSALRSSLPQYATRLVRSRNRMLATKEHLQKLAVSGIQLEASVDQAFRVEGPWKRDEVRRNLSDGQKVITLMSARAQDVHDQGQKLLGLLASAATTDSNLGRAPTPQPPNDTPTTKATRRPESRAPSTRPAAKPAAAAAPKREDDTPSPKPVQGNAPAEIEP